MSAPQIIHCKECVFYTPFTEGHKFLGHCHLNAPIIYTKGDKDNKTGMFPIVRESNFCGQAELPDRELGEIGR